MTTTTRSNNSREPILVSAESVILHKGSTGISIDDIIDKASIIKGGFLYHFDSKSGLAEALMQRYLKQDDLLFNGLFDEANELSEDPLHRLLIFLKLLAHTPGNLNESHPGCLVASFTYESTLFNDNIREIMRTGLRSWRDMMIKQLDAVDQQYTMAPVVTHDTLANMFIAVIEGGILLARNLEQNHLLANQVAGYRAFVRMLYGAG